ncbi:hypothetical protein BJY52DRAFT_1196741 [Lactarius psammicola]|nr:hypothetical protein BJY52DRAFT_1196741 [Lactarius psammicola]
MPTQHVYKALKVNTNIPSDPQESLPAPAAPGPTLGHAWHTHSRVPSMKAKAGYVPPDPQDSLLPAPPMPSQPSTGKGRARTYVLFKPVTHDSGNEVFELSDADSNSLQVEPTPDLSKGLLTPLSNTLGTLDSDTWPLVSDMELFFDEFNNTDGEKMRQCNACLYAITFFIIISVILIKH